MENVWTCGDPSASVSIISLREREVLGFNWRKLCHDILTNTLGGLLVVFLISGALGGIGQWLLQGGVTLPGWLAVPLLGLVGFLLWGAWPRIKALLGSTQSTALILDRLDETEWLIILVFLKNMTETVSLNELSTAIDRVRFRIDQAADSLCERDLIERKEDVEPSPTFKLLQPGRDLLADVAQIFEPGTVQEEVERALQFSRSNTDEQAERLSADDLTEREVRTLKFYGKMDGSALSPGMLAEIADESHLWGEAAMDDLTDRGLLEFRYRGDAGRMYELTSDGRRLVLEEGWGL